MSPAGHVAQQHKDVIAAWGNLGLVELPGF